MNLQLAEKILVGLAPLRDGTPAELVREAFDLARAFDAEANRPAPAPSSPPSCDAPEPPATYVPKVGDVVGIDGGVEYGETRVVTAVGARVTYVRLNSVGKRIYEHTMDVSLLTYLRPASASERAAAGLPPAEREGRSPECRDAADQATVDDAKEREAFRVWLNGWGEASKWTDAGFDNVMDQLMWRAWLARACAAAPTDPRSVDREEPRRGDFPESAREGLAKALYESWGDNTVVYGPFDAANPWRSKWLKAADAAIAYFKNGGAS